MDRWDHVGELDGLECFAGNLLHLELVARFALEQRRVLHPLGHGLLARQVPLHGLAERNLLDVLRRRERGDQAAHPHEC